MTPGADDAAPPGVPLTAPILRECLACGALQTVPALAPGTAAECGRCGTVLRRATRDGPRRALALTLTALVLLGVMYATVLLHVETAGIRLQADIVSGPDELLRRGMVGLAAVVAFTTVAAPLLRLLATAYVLIRLRARPVPRHLASVFKWVERLGPWSMIEVFLFGVFVAYVKLGDIVHITPAVGVYALMLLTVVLVWSDSVLDHEAVWAALDRDRPARPAPPSATSVGLLACETCRLVDSPRPGHAACRRCDSALHPRKPDSIARTWALVIAAAILYVPANVYPVLTVVQLGSGSPSTILGGVEELVSSGMYPLAALVFLASVAVPMLKLIGLSIMLLSVQFRRAEWLRDRTRLYHFVRFIGRWSMIDIFMESLLGALVRFGSVVTIEPGGGAVAFCAVVILTMLAAETFDPRLMWDVAPGRAEAPVELAVS
jgi:paraquat-inducible protein A